MADIHWNHNPSEESHWVSRLRENFTSGSDGEGLETDHKKIPRQPFTRHIRVTEVNVAKLVKAGRAKWKIENENFNTLKNQGYHAEHNFGHGKKNLSFNFFLFILLAFFMHQPIEISDSLYQLARAKFSARKEFWNQLRCTIRIIIFENWESLLRFVISPPTDIRAP